MIKKYFDRLVHNNDEFNEYLNATLEQDKIIITTKVSFLAALVIFIFGIVDILSVTSNLSLILTIRVCMTSVFVLYIYLIKKYTNFFLKYYHLLIPVAFLTSGLCLLGMILLSEEGGIVYSTYFAGLMLVILAFFLWFYANTTVTVTLSLLIILGYIVVYFLKTNTPHFTDALLLNNLIFLLASITFGLIADVFRKHYLFKNFISQKRLIKFLLPKPHKEKTHISSDVCLSKLEFQKSINDCIFDAKTANLKLIISTINLNSDDKNPLKTEGLISDVFTVFYQQSNHEIKTYKEGNTIWSLSFTKDSQESFKSDLEMNIRKYLKTYKNKIRFKTAILTLENDFEDQKNQTIKELTNIELTTISPNISLVKQ